MSDDDDDDDDDVEFAAFLEEEQKKRAAAIIQLRSAMPEYGGETEASLEELAEMMSSMAEISIEELEQELEVVKKRIGDEPKVLRLIKVNHPFIGATTMF